MKVKELCDLKSCFLCSNSVSAWLASVKAHKTNLYFKKGEAVFEEGQKAIRDIFPVFRKGEGA